MGAKFAPDGDDAIVDINITPFVDIILVVLIIFMLTSSVIAGKQIPVELPSASTGEASDAVSLALTLDEAGTWYLDGVASDPDAIRQRLQSEAAAGSDVVCLIGADQTVDYGEVVKMVDLVRREKVSKFALDIRPTDAPPFP